MIYVVHHLPIAEAFQRRQHREWRGERWCWTSLCGRVYVSAGMQICEWKRTWPQILGHKDFAFRHASVIEFAIFGVNMVSSDSDKIWDSIPRSIFSLNCHSLLSTVVSLATVRILKRSNPTTKYLHSIYRIYTYTSTDSRKFLFQVRTKMNAVSW